MCKPHAKPEGPDKKLSIHRKDEVSELHVASGSTASARLLAAPGGKFFLHREFSTG
jgi:hypothetical protein